MEDPKGTSNRIIFDADFYDDSWWEEIVTKNQIDGDGFWTDLNPENIDDVVAAELIAEDLENEMDALASYLDGTMHCIDGAPATTAGNRLLVRGTVGLWDGAVSGFTPYDDLKSALDTSSSRFGGHNVMADCEIDMIWENDGSLFVSGFHHDGRTTIEVRQLSDAGQAALEAVEDAWIGEPFTVGGVEYDGSTDSVNRAIADIWDNGDMAPKLNYLEHAYGTGLGKVSLDDVEAGARAASEAGLEKRGAEEPRRDER